MEEVRVVDLQFYNDTNFIELEEVIDTKCYSEEEVMIDVVVAEINPKQASEILQEFAVQIPLQQYNLDHVKRVKRNRNIPGVLEILIAPVKYIDDVPQDLKNKCKPITRVVKIPKFQPSNRTDYDSWGRFWPILFRPNELDKGREKGFPKKELLLCSKFVSLLHYDAKLVSQDLSKVDSITGYNGRRGGIIINPTNGKV